MTGLALLGATLGLHQPLRAQSLEEQLHACAAETDSARRLSCYDRLASATGPGASSRTPAAAATAAGAAAAGAAAATPLAPALAATRAPGSAAASTSAAAGAAVSSPDAEFGVREGPLAAKRQPAAPQHITATVTHIAARPRGELVMTLDNGQVWAQLEPVAYFPLKVGDAVEIRAAALGSYQLLPPFKRATKVTRIQ